MRAKFLIAVAASALLLGGCRGASSTQQNGAESDQTSGAVSTKERLSKLPADVQMNLAFEAATGHAKPYSTESDQGVEVTRPLSLIESTQGPILITGTHWKDGCHACSGKLGIFYLSYADEGFKLEKAFIDAAEGEDWGESPKWSMSTEFSDYPVIRIDRQYSGMGCYSSSFQLIELRRPSIIKSDNINLSFDNTDQEGQGSTSAFKMDGVVTNIAKNLGFDVSVKQDASAVDHYNYKNGQFVRSISRSVIFTC